MRPAYSVVFLTTLIGAGQGLFLALYLSEVAGRFGMLAPAETARAFFAAGAAASIALLLLGLVASFFHLGRPERAWRSATRWRTSWLSREVIALPAFIACTAAWGAAHWLGGAPTLALGAVAALACLTLFFCTAMIYACIRFFQEWASPLTVVNFFLIGTASGFTLAAPLAGFLAPERMGFFARGAIFLTALALATRAASLKRNAGLVPRSTTQSAIGIAARRVEQKSQGFTGSSFNTREFFHGVSAGRFAAVKWTFLALGFGAPLLLLLAGLERRSAALLAAAPVVQYAGLVAERWFFLAQANHPQNLYYQSVA